MCINKLLDVEEHVWSPKYGLKGNIDATVQVRMRQGDTERTLTVPFELKTGRKATNHQAQTALYNLLLSDRYDIEIAYGVLYYLESSDTMLVPTVRHELRHMIMQRNRLACHVRERSVQLPPMKKSQALCGRCYAKVGCFIYHRLADDGDGETSGMRAEFDEVVGHLKPSHRDFFLKWEELLTKEEKESWKLRRELWTMAGSERERLGRCFADVVIEPGSASVDPAVAGKVNRFRYTFIRENPPPGFSFLESQLVVGEPIVVSDEQGHFALALGYVTAASRSRLTVAVDRRLHNARIRGPGFDEHDNQTFAGIMDVLPGGSAPDLSQARATVPAVRYRVDKDEFSNGMAMVRNNLIQVMADGSSASRQIRRLVVDLAPPRFKSEPARCATAAASSDEKDGDLNEDQSRAVDKVMSALDYALVLGMPGTGKTTTIAHIIRALVRQGRSVLLASYTHTAVDNILLKLRNDTIPILRLGAVAKVHADVRGFATLAAAASFSSQMSSLEAVREAWHSPPVVATTCLGIGHPLFAERTFDVCIVDEASQITLPVCLGPIRMARAFVLVGDHNQLPPLVQNDEARKGGLDVSLFKLLSDAHPDAVVSLEHQYRMCEPIMLLSNTLIYGGRLKCGTEALRDRRLDVPDLDGGMAALHHHRTQTCSHHVGNARMEAPKASHVRCWLRDLVDGAAQVRFVNTDTLVLPSSQPPSSTAAMAGVAEPGAREEARGNRIVNRGEARVVAQLVAALVACGVPSDEIGVLTHYRSQLSLLRHAISRIQIPARSGSQQCVGSGNVGLGSGIEMHTADRFQGRDKEVVVVSLVRSNGALGQIGDLLKDWRRINVAFTRAKTKLLVVGSRETLKASAVATAKREQEPAADSSRHGPSDDDGRGDDMLARFVALMEDRNWVYDLPPDALDCGHAIDEAGDAATQATLRIVSPKKEAAMAAATAMSIPPLAAEAAFRRIGDMEDFTVAIDRERSAAAKVDATETRPTAGLKSPSKRFGSSVARFTDKENSIVRERVRDENSKAATRVPLKKATADKRVLLKGRPVLRDILNEMMDGQY